MMTYLLQNRILFVSGYLNDDVSRNPPLPPPCKSNRNSQ